MSQVNQPISLGRRGKQKVGVQEIPIKNGRGGPAHQAAG